MNKKAKILNKIIAKESSNTQKGLHTMTNWDLSLVIEGWFNI